MRKVFTALFFLCSIVVLAQPAVSINDDAPHHIFSFREIEYFENKNGKLTINDVLDADVQERFRPSATFNPENANRGSVYWHRIKIRHNTASTKRWVIEFFDQTIDRIDFFIPNSEGKYTEQSYGEKADHESS